MEIDYIQFYVESAEYLRDLLLEQMGLQYLSDLSNSHTTTYSVGNSNCTFWISAPINEQSRVADYLRQHPAGVKDVAFRVPRLDLLRARIEQCHGMILAASEPMDPHPWIRIKGWGAIEHTICAGSRPVLDHGDRSITGIDHVVLNVDKDDLEAAVQWYQDLFDFQVQQDFQIKTARSGLRSKALTSGQVRFNINEPIEPSSQIQEFLDANGGPGIQHIALGSDDILQTVAAMQRHGVAFLPVPQRYYEQLRTQPGANLMVEEWAAIEHLQILVDWSCPSPQSLLMQTFTKPIFAEPTFFFEIIERRNQATGFGAGNFQALFEAIEESLNILHSTSESRESTDLFQAGLSSSS